MMNNGGPAFPGENLSGSPQTGRTPQQVFYSGMSLHDYYTAHALQGLLACGKPDGGTRRIEQVALARQYGFDALRMKRDAERTAE